MDAVIGALRVVLGLNASGFRKGMSQAERDMVLFGKKMQSIGQGMTQMGQTLTFGLTLPILAMGAASVKAAQESADAFAQVEAALKSMGDGAGRSLDQLGQQADQLMKGSLFDDDEIMRDVTSNLLTFGNVAETQFDRAQVAIVDVATRMKKDLLSTTIMVGKALNDPVKGMKALTRAGIQFTDAQKAQITAMVKAGNVAGAQAIMLGELERQFGGAARAAQNTAPWDKLKDSFETLKETIGAKLIPHLVPLIDGLNRLVESFGNLSPEAQNFALVAAGIAAALGPVMMILGPVISGIGALVTLMAAPGVAAAVALAAPWLALAAAVGAVVFVFRDELAPVMKEWAAFVQSTIGPKLAPLFDALGRLAETVGAIFQKVFAPGMPAAQSVQLFAAGIDLAFKAIVAVVGGAISAITVLVNGLDALLRGDGVGMWKAFQAAALAMVPGLLPAFQLLADGGVGMMKKLADGVKQHIEGELGRVWRNAKRDIEMIANSFEWLYDQVVGHSSVPDLITGITAWFARLDAGMVVPTKKATKEAASAFEALRDRVASIFDAMLSDEQRALRELKNDIIALQAWIKANPFDTTARNALAVKQAQLPSATVAAEVGFVGPANLPDLDNMSGDGGAAAWAKIADDWAAAAVKGFEERRDQIAGVLRAGWGDLMKGDLKGALSKWLEAWAAQGLEKAFNSVVDILAKIFEGMGSTGSASGGGGWLATIGQVLGMIPGFANGGSFEIGGSGGVDSKLAMMRVTPGETGAIWKKGQGPGGGGGAAVYVVGEGDMFRVRVQEYASPVAARAAAQALSAASTVVPQEQRRRNAQRLGVNR